MNGNNIDLYLFDSRKRLRQAIVWGVSELIHAEDTFELNAEIAAKYDAMPGEYLGFYCVDGRFRLFRIDTSEYDDTKDVSIIEATDAAISELAHTVVPGAIRIEKESMQTALDASIEGSGFTLGTVTADTAKTGYMTEYYPKRWKALRAIAEEYDVRVIPYYEIADGEITGKKIDILKKENVFRGRMIEGATDSQNIAVIYSGVPVTRMYGFGETAGTNGSKPKDPPDCITFENVVWKKSSGDPADKPSGQAYVEDVDAIAEYGEGAEDVFDDRNEEDPEKLLEKTWAELQRRKRPQVSGVATVSDMEMIPGYKHKQIRLYDKVIVRTRRGKDAESTIVSIKRNYIHPSQTRVTLGEETKATSTNKRQSITQKVATLSGGTRSGSRSLAAGSRYIETKQLIQLNANTIQLNAEYIEMNAEAIKATKIIAEQVQADVAKFKTVFSVDEVNVRLVVTNLNAVKLTVSTEFKYGSPPATYDYRTRNVPNSASIDGDDIKSYTVRLANGDQTTLYAFNTGSPGISLSGSSIGYLGTK